MFADGWMYIGKLRREKRMSEAQTIRTMMILMALSGEITGTMKDQEIVEKVEKRMRGE